MYNTNVRENIFPPNPCTRNTSEGKNHSRKCNEGAEPFSEYDVTLDMSDNLLRSCSGSGSGSEPDCYIVDESSAGCDQKLSEVNVKSMSEFEKNSGKGFKFPDHLLAETTPEYVHSCPPDIDGLRIYKIKCVFNEYLKRSEDCRHFCMSTSSRKGFIGKRKVGCCRGSYVCMNSDCLVLDMNRQPNKSKFEKRYGPVRCYACSEPAQIQKCTAQKCIEYDPELKELTIYHVGFHSCALKLKVTRNDTSILDQLNIHGHRKGKDLQNVATEKVAREEGYIASRKTAAQLVDPRRIAFLAKKHVRFYQPGGGHFL